MTELFEIQTLKRPEASRPSTRARCTLDRIAKLQDFYEVDDSKLLGRGNFGTVTAGVNKATNFTHAIKTLPTTDISRLICFRRELFIMKAMHHPNIIQLREAFHEKDKLLLAMEFCSGGTLFDRIIAEGEFAEKDGASVMERMLSAVCYMHKIGFCHRDLKPENILFATNGQIDQSIVKLIDFGSARFFEEGVPMRTVVGTPYYIAPDVLKGVYHQACDYWSCGVIMFTMLGGYPPFYGQSEKDVLRKVRKGKVSFARPEWDKVSEDAKRFIRALLEFEPEKRMTAEQALGDCWIRDSGCVAKARPLSRDVFDNLHVFLSQNILKKNVLNIIAQQFHCSALADLLETFKALDVNGDGFLTQGELQAGIAAAKAEFDGFTLEAIIEGLDDDGNGVIDYTEFLAAAIDKKLYTQRDVCWAAFNVFDCDRSGSISFEELKQVLEGRNVEELSDSATSEDLEDLLREVDSNCDGEIDFDEFMCMLQD